ncbi:SAGA histone acetyltransferase complex subunit SPT7 KNAG_0J02330 [Huiozyma naganishii CBS 8797]|uniref:SAGA complex subunit Spt7 n=1 Tax=Huiozyma naganishii (strain ATCC MYA-139 / BCRC 22969 / CBS 8797 / KCTC 17520 / NBRC 10181 / NCYC 3082 / Yp74L-3) TaxID=1071383 RepID=J7RR40_HUIN7|nr:hypothetical protein KNAG_0J02330 [Kazachstania naganishii CBS 8797]CCK72313.1 hypothetical protein KNAG_0J02330 [Kazachstania naganishii CBS 8797]
MVSKFSLINYQQTDPRRLLTLTEKLFNDHAFEAYLTPQQLIVLEYILSIKLQEKKFQIWIELMNGNVELSVVNVPSQTALSIDQETTVDGGIVSERNSLQGLNLPDTANRNLEDAKQEATLDPDSIEAEEDMSQLDLDDLNQHISGSDFIGNLSLKIRYVLWQCAVDVFGKDIADIDDLGEGERGELEYILPNDDSDDLFTNDKVEEGKIDSTLTKTVNESEDDNYDDDDDYDTEEKPRIEGSESDQLGNIELDDDVEVEVGESNKLVLKMKISKNTLKRLRCNNFEAIMHNWTKIYHSFENDRETMLKRLKLEKNDELLEPPQKKRSHKELTDTESTPNHLFVEIPNKHSDQIDGENSSPSKQGNKRPKQDDQTPSVNLGIANLSLKHLLGSIQANRSKLNITDYELKHLITDVRKNRSKWTSDDRIGQEELYEACEKVVLELRNYTEHSTPFLNKVSKREAPNYHQIIKKSMDLNTVLKKLKTFQYESKQEFVDDIMLIWKNCLTYNSDPSHFLRAHAIAMQKKSLQLIPMIPNITIRSRADVEKEIADMDKDKDYEDDAAEDEEIAGSGRKGLNMGAHKPAEEKVENIPMNDDNHSTKEDDSALPQDNHEHEDSDADADAYDSQTEHLQEKSNVHSGKEPLNTDNMTNGKPETLETAAAEHSGDNVADIQTKEQMDKDVDMNTEVESKREGETEKEEIGKDEDEDDDDDDDDEGEEEEEDDMADSQSYFIEKDDTRDDIELLLWKSATAKVRAEICLRRSGFFKEGKINKLSTALLKNPQMMKPFEQLFQEYKEQKAAESYRQKIEQESVMKNGFGTVLKNEEEEQIVPRSDDTPFMEKIFNDIEAENSMFLQEYDSVNGLPEIAYHGINPETVEKEENDYVDHLLETGETHQSPFLRNKNRGMNPKINANIQLIQQIRHICHKISLIRMLQNPQYLNNSKSSANSTAIINHRFAYQDINDSLDLDPVSQLNSRDNKNNRELIWRIMHKNVSKISMTNGFETTQPSAINMLTEIAGDYLSNLLRTIKVHQESTTLNKLEMPEILNLTLLENGIARPDSLYSYMEAEFVKKSKKLNDVKTKLENFLKALLRPTLQELSERNFEDESENFVTGNFANELTGEDFFGFKELGLEKEFGVLSSSVPLQLLTSHFQAADGEKAEQVKKIQTEEVDSVAYSKISKGSLESGNFCAALLPFLRQMYERSKNYTLKPPKGSTQETSTHIENPDLESYMLLEDDEMISKTKGSRLRLPPTGKISTAYKKRPINDAFFIPDTPKKSEPEDGPTPVEVKLDEPSQVSENSLLLGTPTTILSPT